MEVQGGARAVPMWRTRAQRVKGEREGSASREHGEGGGGKASVEEQSQSWQSCKSNVTARCIKNAFRHRVVVITGITQRVLVAQKDLHSHLKVASRHVQRCDDLVT